MNTLTRKDQVSPAEWRTRVDLAALYRLTALYGYLAIPTFRLPAATTMESRCLVLS